MHADYRPTAFAAHVTRLRLASPDPRHRQVHQLPPEYRRAIVNFLAHAARMRVPYALGPRELYGYIGDGVPLDLLHQLPPVPGAVDVITERQLPPILGPMAA